MSNYKTVLVCDRNGNTLQVIDEREFEAVREHRLRQIRKRAARLIEEAVPDFKQRNIAMGIISGSEKTALLSQINAIRDYCNGLEDEINAVTWDGKAGTRAAACDAIEAVSWQHGG
jgi:hypothetical protein